MHHSSEVEQLAVNELVPGSNPGDAVMVDSTSPFCYLLFRLHVTCDRPRSVTFLVCHSLTKALTCY